MTPILNKLIENNQYDILEVSINITNNSANIILNECLLNNISVQLNIDIEELKELMIYVILKCDIDIHDYNSIKIIISIDKKKELKIHCYCEYTKITPIHIKPSLLYQYNRYICNKGVCLVTPELDVLLDQLSTFKGKIIVDEKLNTVCILNIQTSSYNIV
jgi:hypothetical protein